MPFCLSLRSLLLFICSSLAWDWTSPFYDCSICHSSFIFACVSSSTSCLLVFVFKLLLERLADGVYVPWVRLHGRNLPLSYLKKKVSFSRDCMCRQMTSFIFVLEFWRYFSDTVFLTQDVMVEMSKANPGSYFCMWRVLHLPEYLENYFFFHIWRSIENKWAMINLNGVFLECGEPFPVSLSPKN